MSPRKSVESSEGGDLDHYVVVGLASKRWKPRSEDDYEEYSETEEIDMRFDTKGAGVDEDGVTTFVPENKFKKVVSRILPVMVHPITGHSSLVVTHAMDLSDVVKLLSECTKGLVSTEAGMPVAMNVRVATFIQEGAVRYGGARTFTDVVPNTRELLTRLLENDGDDVNVHDHGKSIPRAPKALAADVLKKVSEIISSSAAVEGLGNEPGVVFDRSLPLEVIIARNIGASPLLVTLEYTDFLETPRERDVTIGRLYFLALNSVLPKAESSWFKPEGEVSETTKETLNARRKNWSAVVKAMHAQVHTWTSVLRLELDELHNSQAMGTVGGCGVERVVLECLYEASQAALVFGAGFTPDAGQYGNEEHPPIYSPNHLESSARGGWSLGSAGGFNEHLVRAFYTLPTLEPLDAYVVKPTEIIYLGLKYGWLARHLTQLRLMYKNEKKSADDRDAERAKMEAEIKSLEARLAELLARIEEFENDEEAKKLISEKRRRAEEMAAEKARLEVELENAERALRDDYPELRASVNLYDVDPASGLPVSLAEEYASLTKRKRELLDELDAIRKRGSAGKVKSLEAELARLNANADEIRRRLKEIQDNIIAEKGDSFMLQIKEGKMELARDLEESSQLSQPSDPEWHKVKVVTVKPKPVTAEPIEPAPVTKKGCCGGK